MGIVITETQEHFDVLGPDPNRVDATAWDERSGRQYWNIVAE
jgi:hypothetical protein